jgi:hypothetical protein
MGRSGGSDAYMMSNTYFDQTNYRYTASLSYSRYTQSGGENQWFNAASGTAGNTISFTQAMTLDASGRLGIGTTSPAHVLDVSKSANESLVRINGSSSRAYFQSNTSSFDIVSETSVGGPNALYLRASGGGGLFIDSSGNVLVGTTTTPGAGSATTGVGLLPGGAITAQRGGATACYFGRSNDGEVMALYSGTTQRGTVSISGATTTYGSVSDYRLKENIIPITGVLSKIMMLKPSTFNFKEFPNQQVNGFVAHEVAEVEPIAVTGEKDGVDEDGKLIYQSVDPAKLVPLLTAGLQELKAIVDAQAVEIAALKGTA